MISKSIIIDDDPSRWVSVGLLLLFMDNVGTIDDPKIECCGGEVIERYGMELTAGVDGIIGLLTLSCPNNASSAIRYDCWYDT